MARFTYVARKQDEDSGLWTTVEGSLEAVSHQDAWDGLRAQGLQVQDVVDDRNRGIDTAQRLSRTVAKVTDPLGVRSAVGRVVNAVGNAAASRMIGSYLQKSKGEASERIKATINKHRFLYVARQQDKNGTWRRVSGKILALSRAEAMETLTLQGLVVQSVRADDRWQILLSRMKTVRTTPIPVNLLSMTRCFAAMMTAGLPIGRALDTLAGQEEDEVLRIGIIQVRNELEEGASLSKAFGSQPKVFPPLFVCMLKVAESTGNLPGLLQRLALFLEQEYKLVKKAKSAMVYPCFVLAVSIILMTVLFTWVLPPLLDTCISLSSGAPLPLPTIIVQAVVTMLRNPYVDVAVVGGILFAIRYYYLYNATPHGRYNVDKIKLTLPVLGDLNSKVLLARMCNAWAALAGAGYPLLKTLEVLADFVNNQYFRQEGIEQVRKAVQAGCTFKAAFEEVPEHMVSVLFLNMLEVGEQTGDLSLMLTKLAGYYDQEVGYALEAFLALIEPVMMAIMGLIVLVVVLSVFLPLYQVVMHI